MSKRLSGRHHRREPDRLYEEPAKALNALPEVVVGAILVFSHFVVRRSGFLSFQVYEKIF